MREVFREHLDRHEAVEVLVVGAIHYRHAAAPDLLIDLEALRQLDLGVSHTRKLGAQAPNWRRW